MTTSNVWHPRIAALLLFVANLVGVQIAQSDVIKPINNNSAIKVMLPLPPAEYYDFTLSINGQNVVIGQEFGVDGPGCLDFKTEVKALALTYHSQYCGQFVAGKTTEIVLPSLRLSGATLQPDTLLGKFPHSYHFDSPGRTIFTLQRLSHDFSLPKLVPFLTNESEISIQMPMRNLKVRIDTVTKVFEVANPSEARPDINFKRVATKAFPDAKALEVFFGRSSTRYDASVVTHNYGVFKIDRDDQVFSWLKLPWNESDNFQMCQVGTTSRTCEVAYQIGGSNVVGWPETSTYPSIVKINRIDIDHVTVNAADGRSATVAGEYTIQNVSLKFITADRFNFSAITP